MQHIQEFMDGVPAHVKLLVPETSPHLRYFREQPTSCGFTEFKNFPSSCGWGIHENYKLWRISGNDHKYLESKAHFLQAWLYFHLIFTVVRDVSLHDCPPILKFEDLVKEGALQINTNQSSETGTTLNQALRKWSISVQILAARNRAAAIMFMFRTEVVLKVAKRVVYHNCTIDNGGSPRYSTDNKNYEFIPDALALSLMVLGETLSLVMGTIVEQNDLKVYDGDAENDYDGWGPSRFLNRKAKEEDFCKRWLHILQNQLRGNESLKYCAILSASRRIRSANGHQSCTEADCTFRPENFGTMYNHTDDCGGESPNCTQTGPDMRSVLQILSRSTVQDPRIPLISIDEQHRIVVLEHTLATPYLPFAAVSHVWADGWGNKTSNKLYTCQIKRIKRFILAIQEKEHIDGNMPLWMDTLAIPVVCSENKKSLPADTSQLNDENITEMLKELKKRAIEQIHDIFCTSRFTLILDKGLIGMNLNLTPQFRIDRLMRILTSMWMTRLWTLQEAFLSRKLYVAYDAEYGSEGELENLHDLVNVGHPSDHVNVLSPAKHHLLHGLMYPQALGIKSQDSPYTQMVDFWSAARWRVSQEMCKIIFGLHHAEGH